MKHPDVRTAIQAAMRAAFPVAEERVARFYAMQEYALGWRDEQLTPTDSDPGKLLRSRLSLLACSAFGGDQRQALPLAAAIQLIHDFSLIHDDIEDQSAMRRGRPAVWTLWGLAQGINVGDGMFTLAHLALHRMSETGVPAEVVLEIMRRFDQTIATLCEGQYLDLSYEGSLGISEADYLAMIGRKTAVLIAASTGLGAIIGGASAADAQALFEFGRNLGLAFQIQDDVLGIWGDPAETGKPAASDLYRRKLSLPIIHALQTSDRSDDLVRLYRQEEISEYDARVILDILKDAGTRGYTEGVAAFYHRETLAALDSVAGGDPAVLAEIRAIAEKLVGRST